MIESIWLIPLGFVAGLLGSIIGLGGGIIIVPVLTFVGFSPTLAVSNSLFAVFSNSVASTAVYAKQKRIELSLGWKLGLIAVPGTVTWNRKLVPVPSRLFQERLIGNRLDSSFSQYNIPGSEVMEQ